MTTLTKKKSIREEVWLRTCGEFFSHPCITTWCSNRITVFDFHVAHNIPASRGGLNTFDNLKPICARCNYAMGNRYTIDEWQRFMNVSSGQAQVPDETTNVIATSSTNESTNESTNDSTNEGTNESIKEGKNETTHESTDEGTNEGTNESIKECTNETSNETTNETE